LIEGAHELVLERENRVLAPRHRLGAFGEGLTDRLDLGRIEAYETGKLAQRIIVRQEIRVSGTASREILVCHSASHSQATKTRFASLLWANGDLIASRPVPPCL
jgi:hypothetical protein